MSFFKRKSQRASKRDSQQPSMQYPTQSPPPDPPRPNIPPSWPDPQPPPAQAPGWVYSGATLHAPAPPSSTPIPYHPPYGWQHPAPYPGLPYGASSPAPPPPPFPQGPPVSAYPPLTPSQALSPAQWPPPHWQQGPSVTPGPPQPPGFPSAAWNAPPPLPPRTPLPPGTLAPESQQPPITIPIPSPTPHPSLSPTSPYSPAYSQTPAVPQPPLPPPRRTPTSNGVYAPPPGPPPSAIQAFNGPPPPLSIIDTPRSASPVPLSASSLSPTGALNTAPAPPTPTPVPAASGSAWQADTRAGPSQSAGPQSQPTVTDKHPTFGLEQMTLNDRASLDLPSPPMPAPPPPQPVAPALRSQIPPPQRQFSIPDDLPPVYDGPGVQDELTAEQVNLLLDGIENQVGQKNQGSVQISSISFANFITYIPVVVGQPRDTEPMDRVKPAHASFNGMYVEKIDGLSGLDELDIELQPSYEGKLPGTVSTEGVALEYCNHMNTRNPRTNTIIFSSSRLPLVTLTQILNRMTKLRIGFIFSTPLQEADHLLDFIPGNVSFADPTDPTGWKNQVSSLLMQLNRRDVFEDFSASSSMAALALSQPPAGMGLANFYYQVLLGYELLLRLKETRDFSFSGITTQVNANLIISHRWFKNVTTTLNGADAQLRSNCHETQIEGLIRFAEILNWPWLAEMRDYAENVYSSLIGDGAAVGLSCWDWLFGTYLPGKYASYKIMAALVYCTPSLRELGSALFYDSGLVLENRSYWRARTVLGRVMGGLKSANAAHGWVGPCPGVLIEGEPPSFKGYVRLHARRVEYVNVADRRRDGDDDENEGGTGRGLSRRPGESTRSFLCDLGDMTKWTAPLPPGTSMVSTVFEKIRLKKMPLESGQTEAHRECQASLQFKINGVNTIFTCYTLPTFVTAHPCIGEHVTHDREMGLYTGNVVELNQLKSLGSLKKGLTVVNATAREGELVARAWCSERGKHAIIRRSWGTCFACTCQLAKSLDIDIVIWS